MKNKKILLYGVGTFKNRGVEAIVRTSIDLLAGNDITIASYDYDNNKNYYTDKVNYVNHSKKLEELSEEDQNQIYTLEGQKAPRKEIERIYQQDVISEIKNCDICISAGGDNYCYKNNDWLYAIDEEVKRQNKKLILWGASLYEKIEDNLLANDMNLFDLLLIRESITYNEIKKFVPEDKLILIPDSAFALKKEKVELADFYKKGKVIGLNLSPLTIPDVSENNERFQEVISLINYILKNTKYKIALIPHVTTDECNDMTTLNAIYAKFKNEPRVYLEEGNYNCAELKYIISQCDMLIASRTHASIAAYSSCVPTLVIGYSVKSKGIATDIFGTYNNYVIPSNEIFENKLVNKFIWLNKNKKDIKKHLENIIPKMIKESEKLSERMFERLETNAKKQKDLICPPEKCIGCGLCFHECPKKAITFEEDELSYKYPKINKELCINCDLCRKNCPINNKVVPSKFKPLTFAAKNKNDTILEKSTSGGIFSLLAEAVLSKKDGVVYGATQDNLKIKHIRITQINELDKIRGSKYAQSNLIEIFDYLKQDVLDNKYILISGTPCQIGMFKVFLKDYSKVLYVSVVCHGVINDKLTSTYLDQEFKGQTITNFSYRCKDEGWSHSALKVQTTTSTKIERFGNNPLMGLYLLNSFLRESCYNCQYKGSNNTADIILGDYWGIFDYHKQLFDEKGVSALIINSSNGLKFITEHNILQKTTSLKSNINNLRISNEALFLSPVKPLRRYTIAEDMKTISLRNIYLIEQLQNELKNEQIRLNEIISIERNKQEKVTKELDAIYNSKRWKLTNKIFDFFGKIRGKQ